MDDKEDGPSRFARARGMADAGLTTDEIMALMRGDGSETRTLADTCGPCDDSDRRHKALWAACRVLPGDYSDYGGEVDRWADEEGDYPDCAGGCRWWVQLFNGDKAQTLDGSDADWGVCTNSRSHRTGLLTWEHQGCLAFEGGDLNVDQAAAAAEACDRTQANPEQALSADDVQRALNEHHKRRAGQADGS
jgi:hypothetical protein